MQKSSQTWEELKKFWIKKPYAEIGFRTNQGRKLSHSNGNYNSRCGKI